MDNRMKTLKVAIISAVVTAVVTLSAANVYYTGRSSFLPSPATKLDQVINLLQEEYYKPADSDKLMEGAVRGAVDSLGDPYTTYMDQTEWDEFNTYISGSYSGIGVTVTPDTQDNTILVVSPFDDSPAAKAGLKTGDKIIRVNGEDVFGNQLDEAVAKLKGTQGTSVDITVRKAETAEEQTLTLVREDIKIQTVTSRMIDQVGYLRISMFDINTGEEFQEHLDTVIQNGAKALIVDVRQNGGGVAEAAQKVASSLLPPDRTIFYTSNRQGKQTFYRSKGNGTDLPLVILIDEGTASASEILAGCIRDNNRGVLVGKKSFGKGLVQQPFMLADGSVVKVTVEQYYTPNGNDINQTGIQPDHEVDFVSQQDEQLAKALQLLQ